MGLTNLETIADIQALGPFTDPNDITCTSLQTDNHASTLSLDFYELEALPDAQPTVLKHWMQQDLSVC